MKKVLLFVFALLLCLSFVSCGEDETSDTSVEVAFHANNNKPLSDNIKAFLLKGETEGYDTISATYFSDWKVNNIRELTPKPLSEHFYFKYSLMGAVSYAGTTWDYTYPNGEVKQKNGSMYSLEFGVTYFPFECANVIDDEHVAFSFCAEEGENNVYYVFVYERGQNSWSSVGSNASFTSVDEAEAYIQRGGKREKPEVSENMDWSTGAD